jgi:membrane peptidoglycan carboxypeptidase
VLWESRPEREEVLDSLSAAIVRDLMRTALDNGTGYNARNAALGNLPNEVPAAGKTGTTNNATDIWFIGFTPDLIASVWFGFDRPKPVTRNAAGGAFAAPVWGQFMRTLYIPQSEDDSTELEIPAPKLWPEGITTRMVDRETGKLAASWCQQNAYVEYSSRAPSPPRRVHHPMAACSVHRSDGSRATPRTRPSMQAEAAASLALSRVERRKTRRSSGRRETRCIAADEHVLVKFNTASGNPLSNGACYEAWHDKEPTGDARAAMLYETRQAHCLEGCRNKLQIAITSAPELDSRRE